MNEWEWNALEDKASLEAVQIGGKTLRVGDRVRLRPKEGGDILDLALRGQRAIVESIEEDYEGVQHVCVVLEQDPGRDLGMMRQPGHRFFFTSAEIELIEEEQNEAGSTAAEERRAPSAKATILIACIGNIFLGDDGFGVEVARRMQARPERAGVRVVDFGIRGFDLAYALQDGYEAVVLVDAYPHGKEPGTVSVVEPDLSQIATDAGGFVQTHGMHPMNVLRMAKAMNGALGRVVLVGCEPQELGGDEGCLGLTSAVEAAVDVAVSAIDALVNQMLDVREKSAIRRRKENE